MTSSPAAPAVGSKRALEPDDSTHDTAHDSPTSPSQRANSSTGVGAGTSHSTSNFRNVSACNRCRLRKNRCDQRLPACSACEKASHRCVGFDPITKQEIPRSYVYFLESRLSYYESLLTTNHIDFEPADAFDDGGTRGQDVVATPRIVPGVKTGTPSKIQALKQEKKQEGERAKEAERLDKIVDDIGMVTVQGASDRRYLGSTSGISFARVVLAAVKSSVAATSSERTGPRSNQPLQNLTGEGSSIRDSYFGLSTKPTFKEAPFPDRQLGEKLVNLYFEHANPQIPVLHREEFLQLFQHAYRLEPNERTPRQLYLLNIVFAIGAGIIFGSSEPSSNNTDPSGSMPKRMRMSGMPQAQPEEYHASAIVHLSAFLSTSSSADPQAKAGGDLEDLQAVLLLAGFALLRPVAPGLWYIVGVAMRLAIDLGLHFEDGLTMNNTRNGIDGTMRHKNPSTYPINPRDRGKREWIRDLRRRLWWCTYCFDRLVSTCVGRPFGVTDVVVTTEFPSSLDDKYITREGIQKPLSTEEPSYKVVALHYLRLRLLQSEILQVLQYQQAQQARYRGVNKDNPYVHKQAPSPFLVRHLDFRSWRYDVDQRLWEWKESAPTEKQTGVAFSTQFLELNYWQAVIMLYRNSLSVPDQLAGEASPTAEVTTPTSPPAEVGEDQDIVFLKCAEAGQKTLKLYRVLHRRRLVNYTYLATHHLFMAGISFLYAVWHSPAVRKNLTLDDFDFTVLAATSVLGDLMAVCPPAEACRDAFERMSKATVQMCMSTPDFGLGQQEQTFSYPHNSPSTIPMALDSQLHQRDRYHSGQETPPTRRPPPKFDMNLRDLFPDDFDTSVRPSKSIPQFNSNVQRNRGMQPKYGNRNHSLASRQHGQLNQSTPMADALVSSSENYSPNMRHSQTSQGLTSQPSSSIASQYVDINQNSYNPDFMSNLPGLDFLNSLTQTTAGNDPFSGNPLRSRNIATNTTQNLDETGSTGDITFDGNLSDSMMDYGNYDFSPAFNFGDNVGFDFNQQHDWGNGQNGFDLFGGYFFDRGGS